MMTAPRREEVNAPLLPPPPPPPSDGRGRGRPFVFTAGGGSDRDASTSFRFQVQPPGMSAERPGPGPRAPPSLHRPGSQAHYQNTNASASRVAVPGPPGNAGPLAFSASVGAAIVSSMPAAAAEKAYEDGHTIPDPNVVVEHGRTWHGYKDGKYFLPNDADEQDRLDLQHALWLLLMDGALSWAPMTQPPRNVLDIGTGTGIWAIEYAAQHPSSNVIGIDLSTIQPLTPRVPNCRFIRDDVEDEWLFPETFGYIHLRMMFSCFSDQRAVMQTIFDKLPPGGWVEYQDGCLDLFSLDDSLQGTALEKWCYLIKAGATALGRDLETARKLRRWMVETGFVDVVERRIDCPGNGWPSDDRWRRIGRYLEADAVDGVQGMSLRLLSRGLGMSVAEIDELVSRVKRDLRNRDIHIMWPWYIVVGRKPHVWERRPMRTEEEIPRLRPDQ